MELHKLYIVTEVGVDDYEPCEVDTYIFTSKEKAMEFFDKQVTDWKEIKRELFENNIAYEDAKTFEEWLIEAEIHDIETDEFKYLHYVYGCNEKVFQLQEKEV